MNEIMKKIVDAFVSNASNRMHAIGTIASTFALTLGLAGAAQADETKSLTVTAANDVVNAPDYLTFTAEAESMFFFLFEAGSVEINTNGTWEAYTPAQLQLAAGDKVKFRGEGVTTTASKHFYIDGKVAASGDVGTLTDGKGGADVSLPAECYRSMFGDCTGLTTAPALPATNVTECCYLNMFSGCTSLTNAPALPAETLVSQCYDSMFAACEALPSAPALPATTLAPYCYSRMFYGCKNLTSPPEIPATLLMTSCCDDMFSDCASMIVNTTPTPGYEKPWSVNATTVYGEWSGNMFAGTAGTFTGNTENGVTYYIKGNAPVAILAEPTPVEHAKAAVYTNGVLSSEIASGKWAAWSNETATVVYTAEGGYFFADGTAAKTNALDTTVSPAVVKGGTPAAPAEPSVMVGKPAQRYPWNGVVDVPYRVKNWPAGGVGRRVKFLAQVGEVSPVDGGTVAPAAGGTVTGTYAIDFKKLGLPTNRGEATVKAAIVAE